MIYQLIKEKDTITPEKEKIEKDTMMWRSCWWIYWTTIPYSYDKHLIATTCLLARDKILHVLPVKLKIQFWCILMGTFNRYWLMKIIWRNFSTWKYLSKLNRFKPTDLVLPYWQSSFGYSWYIITYISTLDWRHELCKGNNYGICCDCGRRTNISRQRNCNHTIKLAPH